MNPALCWHAHPRSGLLHAYTASSNRSLCRMVREPAGDCVADPPASVRVCANCAAALRRVRSTRTRYQDATSYVESVAAAIAEYIPAEVRAWPAAVASAAPVVDRLLSLVLMWELTGRREVLADVHDVERELLDTWKCARDLWAGRGRRR